MYCKHKRTSLLFVLTLAVTACGGGSGGSNSSGFTNSGTTTPVTVASSSQVATGADNQLPISNPGTQTSASSITSSQLPATSSKSSSSSSSDKTSSISSSQISVINFSSSSKSSSSSNSFSSFSTSAFSSSSSVSSNKSSSLSSSSSSKLSSSLSSSSSIKSSSLSSSSSSKFSSSSSSTSSSKSSSSSSSISSNKSSSSSPSNSAPTLLWQADFNDGVVLGVAQAGAIASIENGAYKVSYPQATSGEQYSWLNYDAPANTKQLYISFKAKMPGNKAGLKFFKVFGKQGAGGAVSNSTFGLDYTGIDDGIGSLYAISFGDGASPQNDTQNVIFLSGDNPGWIGRSYEKTAIVKTPMKKAFKAANWGTEWHTFKIMVKFNDGTSSTNEIANGAYYLEIDGNVYADATGLFNRHYNSGDINHIEFGGWAQGGKNGPNPAFDIYYDDIVVSSGGWVNLPANSSSSSNKSSSSNSSSSSKLSSSSSSSIKSSKSSNSSSSKSSSSAPIDQPVSVIGPIEIISWAPARAYPNVPFSYRVGVIGGQAPYTYAVISGPTGLSISSTTGELAWTAPSSSVSPISILLRATDSLGSFIDQNLSIEVSSSGFYFVSITGSDATGTGSISNPWKTISHALNKGATGDTLYVRGGSYTGGFDFVSGKITRILGFPGDTVPAIDLNHTNINPRSSRTWVEGLEIYNFSGHGFHVDGNQSDLVFRRNHMHHLYDPSQSENPSFIFFADNDYYDRIIIQDNKFHDLFDRGSGLFGDTTANYHGGASVMYNVRSALVENNEVWAIDGPCFKDKDNGQRNTFRGNNLHDCTSGAIHLSSQYTQDRIEVSWNLLSGGISIGQQPGYIRDIDIRHNTILGGLDFGCVVGDPNSVNFIIRDNIFIADNYFTYASINCKFADNTIDFSSQNKTLGSDSRFDYNLIDSSYAYVFGYGWYATNMDWVTWRSYGKDAHSKKIAAQLHNITLQDYYPKVTSPACGSASDGRAIGALPCVP